MFHSELARHPGGTLGGLLSGADSAAPLHTELLQICTSDTVEATDHRKAGRPLVWLTDEGRENPLVKRRERQYSATRQQRHKPRSIRQFVFLIIASDYREGYQRRYISSRPRDKAAMHP